MNKRFVGVLIFAFVVASGASLLLYRLLINRTPQAKAAEVVEQIVLAQHDMQVGSVLKEQDVKLSDWTSAVPAGALRKVQDAVGRGVTIQMYAKEPIIESRLAQKGAGGGLAAMIPPGMRAVAVRVNEVVGVAGFVVAGMRVDVLISGNRPGADNSMGTVTRTLLQNLEVLSAGQDFKKDAEGKPVQVHVVNMLVTPEQAEQLSLAAAQTQLQLILRNPLDHTETKTSGTALGILFSGGTAKKMPAEQTAGDGAAAPRPRPRPVQQPVRMAYEPAPPPKKEQPFVMEIISGSKRSDAKLDSTMPGGK
jgi:pilus assembly protein CpaB